MRVFSGIDELDRAIGTQLGHSPWHLIDQARIDAFAAATGDSQWIHVDQEKAAQGPYGTTIAHGHLTLSLLPMLIWEVYRVDNVAATLNYGSEKVRFPAPVPVDSRVRASVELVSGAADRRGYLVTNRVTIEIDGSDKPACVADILSLVVPAQARP